MVNKLKSFWKSLGPGLITGAADDDPSGIAVYAISGAKFGLAILWTAIVTLPFMIVVQRMAGQIGLISGKGLAGNIKKHYPAWLLFIITFLIVITNIINIGADISGMTAALNLLVPLPPILLSALISGVVITLLIFLSYRQIAKYLKWIAVVMFSYVIAAFLVAEPWEEILYRAFTPKLIFSKDYLSILVAIFGTTISPYLFFWQASEEVEEERLHRSIRALETGMIPTTQPHGPHRSEEVIKNEVGSMYRDVYYGMGFSNLIMFFIIALSASTLFKNGFVNVSNVEEIAQILKPIAGVYANLLFLIGITASGILAIPILAGSAAYALAEVFGWKDGFDNNFGRAKQFYVIIIAATLLGLLIPVLGIHPIKLLFDTAIIFGTISPLLILMVIHMANNPKIMGSYTSRRYSNMLAYILFAIMSLSVILMFIL